MSEAGRRCVFCGSTTQLSKEHVMPRWIWREVYGENPSGSTMHNTEPSKFQEVWMPSPDGSTMWRTIEPRSDQPFMKSTSLTVRAVCQMCNNGWMAELEEAAKPVLMRINSGRPWRVSADEVALLRRWAMKTALINEWRDPSLVLGTDEMRAAVAAGREPPGTWYVGLGRAHPSIEFRITESPLSRGHHAKADGDASYKLVDQTLYGTQHIIIPWRVVLIVRFTPYPVYPPARLDHDLRFMPPSAPVPVNHTMPLRSWTLKRLPLMTDVHLRQLAFWGYGRDIRGGLHLGLDRDGESPAIYDMLGCEKSMLASGRYSSEGARLATLDKNDLF